MKQRAKIPLLLSVSSLVWLTPFVPTTVGQTCQLDCMAASQVGINSGGMTYDHAWELCQIRCKGKDLISWGAIAFSKKDKIYGWSSEQVDRASAERVALANCNKEGGIKCVVENSFYNSCGAVAADGDLVALGTGGSKRNVEQLAMAECVKLG